MRIEGTADGDLAALAVEMFRQYGEVFAGLTSDQASTINALCDTSYHLNKGIEKYLFESAEGADKIRLALVEGWLGKGSTKQDFISYCINEAVPMRPDWKDRIEAITGPAAKGGDQWQTWVKRLGVKGAKWEDLCITIARGACLISFCSGKPIIETWVTAPGFLERREGDLLKDFQDLKTLPDQHKNVVSLLRKKLQEVSGIDGDPFISEGGGTYTRRFEMNISKGDWGGVSEYSDQARGEESEEFFGDGFHIETR